MTAGYLVMHFCEPLPAKPPCNTFSACKNYKGKQIDHTDKMDEHEKDTWQM